MTAKTKKTASNGAASGHAPKIFAFDGAFGAAIEGTVFALDQVGEIAMSAAHSLRTIAGAHRGATSKPLDPGACAAVPGSSFRAVCKRVWAKLEHYDVADSKFSSPDFIWERAIVRGLDGKKGLFDPRGLFGGANDYPRSVPHLVCALHHAAHAFIASSSREKRESLPAARKHLEIAQSVEAFSDQERLTKIHQTRSEGSKIAGDANKKKAQQRAAFRDLHRRGLERVYPSARDAFYGSNMNQDQRELVDAVKSNDLDLPEKPQYKHLQRYLNATLAKQDDQTLQDNGARRQTPKTTKRRDSTEKLLPEEERKAKLAAKSWAIATDLSTLKRDAADRRKKQPAK